MPYNLCRNQEQVMRGKVRMILLMSLIWIFLTSFLPPRSFRHPRNLPNGWKKIVIWTDYFKGREVWNEIFGRLISGECEESRCSVSLEREEISSADAVIFNSYNLVSEKIDPIRLLPNTYPMPEREKYPDQIFIFYSMEPPPRLLKGSSLKMLNNYFNWTMTYRHDSDIVEVFGRVIKRNSKRPKDEIKYVTQAEMGEKKMAMWVASHCPKPMLQRERFLKKLKRYLKVDVYGKCGKRCDNYNGINLFGTYIGQRSCDTLASNYHFYLSLENSLCMDYVTEKVFKAWELGIIPVVFGFANYSAIAPPNSFIDVRDFPSIFALSRYLKKVASDAELYNKYLKWKEDYDLEIGSPYKPLVCDLCKKLHANSSLRFRKSYPDIRKWFVDGSNCIENLNLL